MGRKFVQNLGCAIYQIRNLTNNKRYIGSTNYVSRRFYRHKTNLRHGIHHCIPLQRAWNKYGEKCFVFEILETCEESERTTKEQEYLDQEKPEYNTSKNAKVPYQDPVRHSSVQKKLWEIPEYRSNQVEKSLELWKTPEHRKKHMENRSRSKIKSDDDVRKIREMRSQGIKPKEIAKMFNIRTCHVWNICTRKSWKWVE